MIEKRLLKILSLGDSYTIGEGVTAEERWPVQLAARLRERELEICEPRILACTGWTTGELLAAMDAAALYETYDLVTLLIGVNNQYRGLGLKLYRGEFQHLFDRAVGLSANRPGRVVVLSIPDWGVTPFAVREEEDRNQGEIAPQEKIAVQIDAFNRVNWAISLAGGAHYVDVTGISREFSNVPGYLAADGLHPSGKMYAAWVEQVLSAI